MRRVNLETTKQLACLHAIQAMVKLLQHRSWQARVAAARCLFEAAAFAWDEQEQQGEEDRWQRQ